MALIERDQIRYGDEVLRGWGKTTRKGLMMNDRLPAASELDLLISNVIVIDPVLGVLKASIGVKDGLIAGVGRAGNPDVVDNPDLLIGSATAPVYGQGFIATPGAVDTLVHLVHPRLVPVALAAGMTTSTPCNLRRMFEACEHQPINLGILERAAAIPRHPAIVGVGNLIGSSTTPTIPCGRNVVAEHHAMMWSVQGMNPKVPSAR